MWEYPFLVRGREKENKTKNRYEVLDGKDGTVYSFNGYLKF